ncbi:hypothetical protein BKA80DRAFT_267476 [Phyllosticta citrichinensis]
MANSRSRPCLPALPHPPLVWQGTCSPTHLRKTHMRPSPPPQVSLQSFQPGQAARHPRHGLRRYPQGRTDRPRGALLGAKATAVKDSATLPLLPTKHLILILTPFFKDKMRKSTNLRTSPGALGQMNISSRTVNRPMIGSPIFKHTEQFRKKPRGSTRHGKTRIATARLLGMTSMTTALP